MTVSLVLNSICKGFGFSVSSNFLTKIGFVEIIRNQQGFDRVGLEYRKFVLREISKSVNCALNTVNHLPPNGHYMGRTAQLTSRCCILYIYSTNIRTEYFKHAA